MWVSRAAVQFSFTVTHFALICPSKYKAKTRLLAWRRAEATRRSLGGAQYIGLESEKSSGNLKFVTEYFFTAWYWRFQSDVKHRLFSPNLQINLLVCKFFRSTGEPPDFQSFDQSQWSIGWLYCAFLLVESLGCRCFSAPKKLTD